jgi:hypothetical protein
MKAFLILMSIFGTFAENTRAETPDFRTPAKRYGSAYSVKVTLIRKGFTFVVPMWVRPDQKDSTLDPGQLNFLGWTDRDYVAEDLILSGEHLGRLKFKTARSDWAVKPDYPKNCCMGVIGQDVLSHYRLRFDPAQPSNIEWTGSLNGHAGRSTADREFEVKLRPLFSVESEMIKVGGREYDLGVTPFQIDFKKRVIQFERDPVVHQKGSKAPIFSYEFTPIGRQLLLRDFKVGDSASAKKLGLAPGARVVELNGVPVSGLDRSEIESFLRGKKGKRVEIGYLKNAEKEEKSKLDFDFEKNEFTQPRPVQSPARRN